MVIMMCIFNGNVMALTRTRVLICSLHPKWIDHKKVKLYWQLKYSCIHNKNVMKYLQWYLKQEDPEDIFLYSK